MTGKGPLEGKRLLVVEDEFLIARELAQFLEDQGAALAAMTGQLEAAQEPLDGAVVDVQLGAEQSYPLIDRLRARGVPLIILTGYNQTTLREDLTGCPILAKPFQEREFERLAVQLFAPERASEQAAPMPQGGSAAKGGEGAGAGGAGGGGLRP